MLNLEENQSSSNLLKIAAYFNAELDEVNDNSTITMDNDKGKGFISSYQIFKGLSVWVYNITFQNDFNVKLELSEDSPYYFCYNVRGYYSHQYDNQKVFTKVLQNQNMIIVGSPKTSAQITFPANIKLEIAFVVVDMNLLGTLEIRTAKIIHTYVQKISKIKPNNGSYINVGEIDSKTKKYASIVCENKNTDLVGGLLTEGAVLNMLASQIKSFNEASNTIDTKLKLSKSELSILTSLGDYVIEHLDKKITINELSSYFQLSPKKLQIGIKHLYGSSVAQYICNIKMSHAKEMFNTTDLNVSEVCCKIGISSQSYFSKVFKSRYGISPSEFKNLP